MADHNQKLHISPGRWYGWQMIPGYRGNMNVPYFSPIKVTDVTPTKSGHRILALGFRNVFYAEGVQLFRADLRILKHEANYLIAEIVHEGSGPSDRTAVVSHVEFEWLERFCPELRASRPPEAPDGRPEDSVSRYLDAVFGR